MTKYINLYGPPGTGKTTTLTEMVAKAADKGSVVVLSYTKAAAKEIASRIAGGTKYPVRAGTIHSFCFQNAGMMSKSVVNDAKLADFSREIGIPIASSNLAATIDYEQQEVGNAYLRLISLARASMALYGFTYEHSERPGDYNEFEKFQRGYESWKRTYGFYDFDDMLEVGGTNQPIKLADFVFVDEAQDLSPMQWCVVETWASHSRAAVVAGDDDQAIHEWAGADPHGMAKFAERYGSESRVLSVSHRLPVSVYDLSKRIISEVSARVDKPFTPASDRPGQVNRSGSMYGAALSPGTLVLARNHMIFSEMTAAFNEMHIPYSGAGSPLYRGLAELAIGFHESRGGHLSMPALYMARRIYGDKRADAIANGEPMPFDPLVFYHQDGSGEYLGGIIAKYGSITAARAKQVELCTIHSAKGREANNVVLINGMTNRTADNWARNRDSELRVFYVGATRARESLTVVDWENAVEIFD